MNENTRLRWHMPGDERGGWKGEGKKKARGQINAKGKRKRKAGRQRRDLWPLMGDGKGNSWERWET